MLAVLNEALPSLLHALLMQAVQLPTSKAHDATQLHDSNTTCCWQLHAPAGFVCALSALLWLQKTICARQGGNADEAWQPSWTSLR